MNITKIRDGIVIDGQEFIFTKELIESGFIINNDTQMTIEVNEMIKLLSIDCTIDNMKFENIDKFTEYLIK